MREDLHPKDLFLRFDHQTFRKLPRTRGIMFGVCATSLSSVFEFMLTGDVLGRHPVLKRMEDLADNPLVPALLAKIHTDSDETLMKVASRTSSYASETLIGWEQYKSVAKYQHKLVPYLQELTERQIAKGLIKYVG